MELNIVTAGDNGPIAGTFTVQWRRGHAIGCSDRVAHNAEVSEYVKAQEQAYERAVKIDDAIRAAHKQARLRHLGCEVCSPLRGFVRRVKQGVAYRSLRWLARYRARIANRRSSRSRY